MAFIFDPDNSIPAVWLEHDGETTGEDTTEAADEVYPEDEAPQEESRPFVRANAIKASDIEPSEPEATAQAPRTAADVMRAMPLQRFGAGLVKGVLTPAMAIAKIGVRGALEAGLLTSEQLKALGDKERELNKVYEETFQPSGAGQFVGEMLLPSGKIKAGAGAFRTLANMSGKGALYGGMTGAAEGDVTDDEYFNRVVSGSGIGAVAAPIMGAGIKTSLALISKLAGKVNLGRKSAPEILDALNMPSHKIKAVYGATEGEPGKIAAELRKADALPVPGYQPTAATKTARLKMAILPAAEEKVVREETTKYGRRTSRNIAALRRAIRSIAGTPAARNAAEAARADA